MKEEDKIRQIFTEIDNAIKESISDKPVTIDNSKFIKKLGEIKNKYIK